MSHSETNLRTQPNEAAAQQPFQLEIAVDRGAATFPYTLPDTPLAETDMHGSGAPENRARSPAYTHIAANPSAIVTMKQGADMLGTVNWGDLEAQQTVETQRVRPEVPDSGKNLVKVAVLVALDFTSRAQHIGGFGASRLRISTHMDRQDAASFRSLELRPNEGSLIELA